MKCRMTVLATAVALAFCQASNAQNVQGAAEGVASVPAKGTTSQKTQEAKPVSNLAAVTVSGFRESLQKALEIKRNANAIVDAISAEDVGKFPDTNVAESLSHLPGISVDHVYGEGEKVSILGTDPALNRTLLNGQTIASTDWGGTTNGSTRTFNFTILAPDIIGNAEVYKSPEARIDEGSLGGTVILHTREPLDLKANTITGSVDYGYNDRANKGSPNASLLYSWKNAQQTFGVVASVMHSKDDLERDGIEVFDYPNAATAGFPTNVVSSTTSAVYPNAINLGYFRQQRTRDTVSVGVQFNPTDKLNFDLTGMNVRAKYDYYNNSRYAYFAANTGLATSATVDNGLVDSAQFGDGAVTELDADSMHTIITTNNVNLKTTYYADTGLTTTFTVGKTRSAGGSGKDYFMELTGVGGYSYALDHDHISLTDEVNPADPSNFSQTTANTLGSISKAPTLDQEKYAQLDFSQDLDVGWLKQILFGGKYMDHDNDKHAYNGVNLYSDVSLSQLSTGTTPSGYLSGIYATQDMKTWATIDRSLMQDYLNSLPGAGLYTTDYSNTYTVNEKIRDLYLQTNFSNDAKLHGNVGIRYAKTSDAVTGYDVATDGSATSVSKKSDYRNWLPSLNIIYDLQDNLTLRFAASKVIARPLYNELTPYVSKNDTLLTASAGNPNLKPYRSTNFDASAEYYFTPDSMLGLELFKRNISSYVIYNTVNETYYDKTTGGTANYVTSEPINGTNAKVKGFSLMYQGGIGAGFGVMANYTYSDASSDADYELPYNSKSSINLSPYFEKGPLSLRLSANWRSKYFTAIGSLGSLNTTKAYTELDFSASYQATDNLALTLNAQNLLDAQYYSYDGVTSQALKIYKSGRRYMAGLRFKF